MDGLQSASKTGNGAPRPVATRPTHPTRPTRRGMLGQTAGTGAALLAAACGLASGGGGAPKVQPATVRYLHVVQTAAVWTDNWGKIFSTFEEKNPGFKVQIDPIDALQKVPEKAIATFAGGDYYDMLYGHFTTLPGLIDIGIIQPLDSFLSKDRDVKADDFLPAATERFRGKTYGFAWFTQGKEIWYNADLLANSGAPNPKQLEKDGKWTWDALLEVAKKVGRTEGDQITVYGLNESFTDYGTFCHNLWAWGADWFDKAFAKPTIDAAAFLTATQFAVDLVAKHRVASGGDFAKGQVGMQVTSGSAVRGWADLIQSQQFKIEHTMMPKGLSGARPTAMANNCNYICKGSKAPDATWLFDKHLLSKDVQPFIAGLGGGRYTANKKIKPTTVFPVEDAAVFEASAALSHPTPLLVKQTDLQAEWTAAWKAMTDATRGVKEALTQLQERAAQLLKDGCIC